MTYLLDANVFIQAKNLQYGFDFCPAFWDWLDEQSEAGHVGSIEKVLDELKAGGDDLSTWAITRPGLFAQPDTPVVESLQAVSRWAASAHYDPAAVSTFLQDTDYYLVAHAHAHELTVITHPGLPADSLALCDLVRPPSESAAQIPPAEQKTNQVARIVADPVSLAR